MHDLLPPDKREHAEILLAYLTKKGLYIEKDSDACADGTALILFDGLTDRLTDLTHQITLKYQSRFLAIHFSPSSPEHSRTLMQLGATDILQFADCDQTGEEILARIFRWQEIDDLLESNYVKNHLVGESPSWKSTLRQLVEVAHFTDVPVLIQGQSGTGKELIAHMIHTLDNRKSKKEFIILDCSTITPELSGSEFFGHERGAFTGAVNARDGAFVLADGGTLFLDEVGELPLHLQTQLLRVIQEQTFKRVGGNTWQRTAFRLVCATNRDLWAEVEKGRFRADLYFRLASFVCQLPPLQERMEDVLPLARHFLNAVASNNAPLKMDTAVEEYLLNRAYPGNIRDLRQVIIRLKCRHAGKGTITLGCIPPTEREHWYQHQTCWHEGSFELAIKRGLMHGAGLKDVSRMAEEIAIRVAVEEADGNLQQAAQKLGVTDRTLQLRDPRNTKSSRRA